MFLKILRYFLPVILFTVIIGTVFEYYSAKSSLPRLLTEIRTANAAAALSSFFTREQSWDHLTSDLNLLGELELKGQGDVAPIRFVVRDEAGRTLYNSFSTITVLGDTPLLEGGTKGLVDYSTMKEVGTVTVYIGRQLVDREAAGYMYTLVKNGIPRTLAIMVIAIIVSIILSRIITKPIADLTEAADRIGTGETSLKLPVRSDDESGRMSRSFNSMVDSLNKQKEMRKILIRNISHDIGTPLNIIRLEARGLTDKLTTPESASAHIIEEVDKLKNLINDLDWLAETDSGEFRLSRTECDLSELIKNEFARWQIRAAAEGFRFELKLAEKKLPLLDVDGPRISQALGNLIDNSLKYSEDEGIITVSMEKRGQEILISVRDSGSGIDEGDIPFLFERFYRSEKGKNIGKPGRGLGLSIVRQIAELHGGTVGAKNNGDGGSLFYFTLPL